MTGPAVRAVFDAAAQDGPAPLDWSAPITLAALAAAGPDEATRLVLDVGCGEAGAYRGPVGLGPDVTVVLGDLSYGALRHARAAGRPLAQLDGVALPFATGSVDRIVCSLTLGFSSDPVAALTEFARVLADDGRAVVAELSRQRDASLAFTQRLLAEELAGAGVSGPLRTPLPPLRRIAGPAGLLVTATREETFPTGITSPDHCWDWFTSTHRTALARIGRDRVDRLRERIVTAAADALAAGPLRSAQGVTLTVLTPAAGAPR
ncbi:class I SAM-dependent methyltransferase [Micromonospora sp. WMMD882]|uniref:class I SAM-dependent methyltransferase n=1 Tax=Micromonospora sp. WMMD882 TaxID=3015151 RepID=UPI00248C9BB1|nr:class I SAM-dependent methyltransferase [Micromonospora sp. WMMD882]WBB78068.1 class I SAM-dependent methyltransferase [Micromonospora sp. WMMD882]